MISVDDICKIDVISIQYAVKRRSDLVCLPISRVDRSNTCPKNMPAKVLNVAKNTVILQSEAGVIKTRIGVDHVAPWTAACPAALKNAPSTPVSLIGAYRHGTSYTKHNVCHCKSMCETLRCTCRRAEIKCGTKCYVGTSC